jgi:4-alpha-glucanotransferase
MTRRAAGILVPIFSLRTERDLGRGDIGGLAAMLDLALAMGHRIVQLLPLDETGPGESSPYSAASVMAIDPIHIAVDQLPVHGESEVGAGLVSLRGCRSAPRAKVRKVKLEFLRSAYERFRVANQISEKQDFELFQTRNAAWLPDYALFRALKDRFSWRAWETWPRDLSMRDPAILDMARKELAMPIEMYSYFQFLAHRQLRQARRYFNERGASIGGDLAFSPGRDSAEVWANQDQFDLTRFVGAPPDAFNPQGQRWGLPMPNWSRMRSNGWSFLRMRMRRARELYDLVRIDHVVGLFRTYNFGQDPSEPGCFTPADEMAQRDQGESIMRAIIEEAGESGLIAEDLGVVPPWVHATLDSLGIPGYKVIRWEKRTDPDGEHFIDPAQYPEASVATTGTHDTETFVEWFGHISPSERADLFRSLNLDASAHAPSVLTAEMLNAVLQRLYAAPSRYVIEPVQDLFGWKARINRPGTVSGSNWSYRLPLTIERMLSSNAIGRRLATLRDIAVSSGRYDS